MILKGINGDYTFEHRQLYLSNAQWSMFSFRPFNIVINWKHRSFSVFLHASSVHCSAMLKCDLQFVSQCPPSGPYSPVKLSFTYVSNLSRRKIKACWRSVKTREECYTPGCLISTSVWMSLTWRDIGKHTRPHWLHKTNRNTLNTCTLAGERERLHLKNRDQLLYLILQLQFSLILK